MKKNKEKSTAKKARKNEKKELTIKLANQIKNFVAEIGISSKKTLRKADKAAKQIVGLVSKSQINKKADGSDQHPTSGGPVKSLIKPQSTIPVAKKPVVRKRETPALPKVTKTKVGEKSGSTGEVDKSPGKTVLPVLTTPN